MTQSEQPESHGRRTGMSTALFSRRETLALGAGGMAVALTAPMLARVRGAQAGQALTDVEASGNRVPVLQRMAVGSIHAMKTRKILYVVTEPGWGLEFPIGVGETAMNHPDDSFFRIGDKSSWPGIYEDGPSETPALHIHDYFTDGDTGLRIAATDDSAVLGRVVPQGGIHMRPGHLAELYAYAPVGANGILYW